MTNKAKSQAYHRNVAHKTMNELQEEAAQWYKDEQSRQLQNGERRKGLRKICEEVSDMHFALMGEQIKLSHVTLKAYVQGRRTQAEYMESKQWLEPEEEEVVVKYAVEMAERGFPLSPKRIREHALQILQKRLGSLAPENGLNGNWATRFINRHHDRLGRYWSRPLDKSRARAVNPTTKDEFFQLLKQTVDEDNIPSELIYGADETGIQTGIGTREFVIGAKGRGIQHQQRDGNRENITVLPTICADGTSLAPAVIYKGECYQSKWLQNNPLSARLGYQKNGYTDSEIGRAWIEDFDKQTSRKAGARTRLLLVDGHKSHYTLEFLQYARDHNIRVLCYPSHSTHIYQGLDVVVFSPLKRAWSDTRDQYERSGGRITKLTFLSVYAQAHLRAFTPANIKSAFEKTGIVPFNPDVIPEHAMAPSLETSTSTSRLMPLAPASPVKDIVSLIRAYQRKRKAEEIDNIQDNDTTPTPSTTPTRSVPATLSRLSSTSASFLVSNSPIRSASQLPNLETTFISPQKKRRTELLSRRPITKFEVELQAELHHTYVVIDRQKGWLYSLQAQAVLREMYTGRVRGQLEHEEERQAVKKSSSMRLHADGRAKLLTHDEFFTLVQETSRRRTDDAAEVAKRRDAKAAAATELASVLSKWEAENKRFEELNKETMEVWEKSVSDWERERGSARAERRKTGWNKPVKPTYISGALVRPPPKPKLADFLSLRDELAEGDDSGGESGGDDDNDMFE
ncbi:hypothetical protein D9757_001173 [Collybiopsis confluens]|uniref:HTH CENPB-type domain-containing protein n=1 Tax=Collybiopsis confluens TaxID=2823264 RepID=A0A8H5I0T5_9AGAR|nr:hypothetical protein D9757_001173 [Collybiopsis confluens]